MIARLAYSLSWRLALVLAAAFGLLVLPTGRALLVLLGALLVLGLVHRPARRLWRWLLIALVVADALPLFGAVYGDGLAAALVLTVPAALRATPRGARRALM